jgi:hypothetical protein
MLPINQRMVFISFQIVCHKLKSLIINFVRAVIDMLKINSIFIETNQQYGRR